MDVTENLKILQIYCSISAESSPPPPVLTYQKQQVEACFLNLKHLNCPMTASS